MIYRDFVKNVAANTGLSQKMADEVTKGVCETIGMCLVNGDDVAIPGFGKFKLTTKAERTGHNPRTGEAITIPAHDVIKFMPTASLKSATK